MKKCLHCNIEVGGNLKACPLCQSPLKGEGERDYFPQPKALKTLALPLKILLFLILSGAVVMTVLEVSFTEGNGIHWSYVVDTWIVVILLLIRHFAKNHRYVPRIIFWSMLTLSALIILTGQYCGFRSVSTDIIMPILCSATLIVNFIFCMVTAGFTENALVYMLLNIVVGVLPYMFLYFQRNHHTPIAWVVTLLISIVTFIGLVIFKGKNVKLELEKRFHL